MQGIFLKIYCLMMIAALSVGLGSYNLSSLLNEQRLKTYVDGISQGSFVLIAHGLTNKNSYERQRWLASIEKMSGLKINILMRAQVKLVDKEQSLLNSGKSVIHSNVVRKYARVYHAIPGDNKYLLSVDIHDINEQLARVASLLIIKELHEKAHTPAQRQDLLASFKQQFDFPLALVKLSQLNLDYSKNQRLIDDEMVVALDEKILPDPSLIVYAPTYTDDELLVLGPIPQFNWAPKWFIYSFVSSSFFVMAFMLYLILRPLQKRLERMGQELENLDLGQAHQPMTVSGHDMLSLFTIKVNAMANRIQKLMTSQRELTQAVSHELRTPIARIKFHLALLDDISHQSEYKHWQGIQSDVNILESLVDEILTHSQLEQEQPQLQLSEFNLYQVLSGKLQEVQSIRPDIHMSIDCPESIHQVVADQHYLLRAFQNLLVNAQRHAQSQVKVHLYQQGIYTVIDVEDDGDGIDDAYKAGVFQPFKRIDSSRNRKSGGYGLGLAIAFQAMRWHQGQIKLTDSDLGGCCFSLQWPLLTPEAS